MLQVCTTSSAHTLSCQCLSGSLVHVFLLFSLTLCRVIKLCCCVLAEDQTPYSHGFGMHWQHTRLTYTLQRCTHSLAEVLHCFCFLGFRPSKWTEMSVAAAFKPLEKGMNLSYNPVFNSWQITDQIFFCICPFISTLKMFFSFSR